MHIRLCLPFPGTYAVMSVMIGGVTERVAPDSNYMMWNNQTNASEVNFAMRDADRVQVAAAVTFLSGLFQVNWSLLDTLVSKSNIWE